MPPNFQKLDKGEKKRMYVFANGNFAVENVVAIAVSERGTHRLETADGRKFIVPAGWLAIEIEAAEWSI